VSNYFKKLSKSANRNVCLRWLVMTSSPVRIQTSSLFILEDSVKFNIWDVVSAV